MENFKWPKLGKIIGEDEQKDLTEIAGEHPLSDLGTQLEESEPKTPTDKFLFLAKVLRSGMAPYTPLSSKEEAQKFQDTLNFGPENVAPASYWSLVKKAAASSKKDLTNLYPNKTGDIEAKIKNIIYGTDRNNRIDVAKQSEYFYPKEIKQKALHKLSGRTEIRRNPITGEREFKLYRGFAGNSTKDPNNITDKVLSFTPNKDIASEFGNLYSAWVPESKILNILRETQLDRPKTGRLGLRYKEDEIIVAPGIKREKYDPLVEYEKTTTPSNKHKLNKGFNKLAFDKAMLQGIDEGDANSVMQHIIQQPETIDDLLYQKAQLDPKFKELEYDINEHYNSLLNKPNSTDSEKFSIELNKLKELNNLLDLYKQHKQK